MSWEDAFAAERQASERAPLARNPATFGEIWNLSWQAAGLDTVFGVREPWDEAVTELRQQVETAAGMTIPELARQQGRQLRADDRLGSRAEELAELAGGLHPDQQEQIKLYLDVPARARAKAAERERLAAEVGERTFGLSGHATGFLAGLTRQAIDPVNLGTMFVGGPLRGPVLKMLAREFGYGAAVQAVQEPFIEAGRAELGIEAGLGRAVGNIFEAGIGNAGLAGLFRGGAWLLRQGVRPADAVSARPGEAAPAPAGERRLDGGAPESVQDSPPARPGMDSPADRPPLPAALRELSPDDLSAVAMVAERDQLVDGLAPVQSSLGKSLHGEAVEAAIARLETAGGDALARFDQVLADLDRRLEEGSRPAPDRETGIVPVPAAAPAARKRVREPKPVSLGRFIAMNGGLRLDADARNLGLNRMFVPGVGMVGRANGRLLDRDLEPMLIAAGYLRGHDPNLPARDIRAEIYDALEQEFKMKRPLFAAADADAVARLEEERAFRADARLYDERLADEIEAEAGTIRAQLAEAGIDPATMHDADIAEAAELLVRGAETSWEDALERIAIRRMMGDDAAIPARAEIAEELPPGWEIDDEVSGASAPADRGAAGGAGEGPGRQADRGGPATAGRDLPGAGEAGAAPGGQAGDPALTSLGRLAAALPDAPGYRARLADLERALADDPGLIVALNAGDVPARKLLDDIAADADAADALKACLGQASTGQGPAGQKGGDA